MNRQFLYWLVFGLLLGAMLGIATGKGDPKAPIILGAIGAGVSAVGFAVVLVAHKASGIDTATTNYLALFGSLFGAVCGGFLGAITALGSMMIALFNPDLPAKDFQALFGAIGGIVLGAIAGALTGAALPRCRGRKAEPSDAANSRQPAKSNQSQGLRTADRSR